MHDEAGSGRVKNHRRARRDCENEPAEGQDPMTRELRAGGVGQLMQ